MTDNQPIPVAEATAAVRAAIELCKNTAPGFFPEGLYSDHRAFMLAARDILPGALEYLRDIIEYESQNGYRPMKEMGPCNAPMLHHAVAPIVAWHRAQGGKR